MRKQLGGGGQEKGQMTLEMLCLLTIFVAIMLTVQNAAIEQGWVKMLVEGPWNRVQGMVENGVWVAPGPGRALHPNIRGRHGSFKGDDSP